MNLKSIVQRYTTFHFSDHQPWKFGLFPHLGFYEDCCCHHSPTGFCLSIYIFFILLSVYLGVESLSHTVTQCIISFEVTCQAVSQTFLLHSHQHSRRVPVFPNPKQHLLIPVFFESSHLSGYQAGVI